MKKTLTMILTLALVICMMPTSAFAADSAPATPAPTTPTIQSIEIGEIPDTTYTGQEIKPEIAVTAIMSDNTKRQLKPSEYKVTYSSNTNVTNNAEVNVSVQSDGEKKAQ